MAPRDDEDVMEIDGHEVRVSHPDKVFFNTRGETKKDLVDYYLAVREPLLRAMGGRPILMQRFPNDRSMEYLRSRRVDWLVVHKALYQYDEYAALLSALIGRRDLAPAARLGGSTDEVVVFAVPR